MFEVITSSPKLFRNVGGRRLFVKLYIDLISLIELFFSKTSLILTSSSYPETLLEFSQ